MKIRYGGDYNPEQWPAEVWEHDHRLFDEASIDTVTVGVFTWALTQPAPDVYDFTVLDRIVGRAAAAGRQVCLATGTGAHPAWLARAHPEVTRTDFEGRKHRFGQRHNSCPSSPVFHSDAIQPASSSLWSAGYSDPSLTCSSSPDIPLRRCPMAQPCWGSSAMIFNSRRSRVPCMRSGGRLMAP